MKKVMIGMSGGVDSSVAALRLQQEGYDVTGVTLKLFGDEDIIQAPDATRTCCALRDVEDARSVAYRLGIEHLVFNFKDAFRSHVMQPFCDSYLRGETPNPCIDCNRHIKFDAMLRRAEALGYDYIATGHYAVRQQDPATGRYLLCRPKDRSKDQTYVLYNLTQHQLAHTLFPLGDLEKVQVRQMAEAAGLVNSHKPDSQDICFVPDGDYAGYIRHATGAEIQPGDFLDTAGNPIGRHRGLIHYTIGQRKGLGLSLGRPAYVVGKDAASNTVTIGAESDLYTDSFTVRELNWISIPALTAPMQVTVKTRYSQTEVPCRIEPMEDGTCRAVFEAPQRAVTAGQSAVFYDGDTVVGGGIIRG